MSERTFIMIKPDAVARGLSGEIIARFERRGFSITGLKLVTITREVAEEHYGEHRERPFFGELVDFITSGPVVQLVVEGENAITVSRTMMGATNPADAAPGTIRGDLALSVAENVIHGSDGPESAERELALHFS